MPGFNMLASKTKDVSLRFCRTSKIGDEDIPVKFDL